MLITGDDVGMVLSPQCFHNLNLHSDIFNHSNVHFWEYMQPGYDTLGFISCTGKLFQFDNCLLTGTLLTLVVLSCRQLTYHPFHALSNVSQQLVPNTAPHQEQWQDLP